MVQWRALAPLLARAAHLIAVSRFEARLFAAVPGISDRRITVIPNGADPPAAPAGPVNVDRDLIVSVGRVERYKGHHRAVAALPALARERPAIHLRVAGSGPFEAELRRLAARYGVEDRVEIAAIPPDDRQAMASLLSSAGAVVLLSEYEAHPIAVMEALALGRPVVVSDLTGLHDLVEQGLVHPVAPSATPDDVARKIDTVLDLPASSEPMKLPTWDECADALLEVYRSAARRPACAS
jgi:glycosyltransferase involved in cell wall biosynthesis